MDLANAFDELAAMLSKIEPDPNDEEEEEEEELVNGNKRRKKAPVIETEAETLGMNRLDLIGRTIDTLRRLHEENTDLKEHPMPGKGEEEVSRRIGKIRIGSSGYFFSLTHQSWQKIGGTGHGANSYNNSRWSAAGPVRPPAVSSILSAGTTAATASITPATTFAICFPRLPCFGITILRRDESGIRIRRRRRTGLGKRSTRTSFAQRS
jgi:hypothetical protein